MARVLLVLLASSAALQGFTPVLSHINPRGGKVGTELEVHFHGERLQEISEALIYQSGLSVTNFQAKDDKHLVAQIKIAPDAPLGEYSIRLRGTGGLTELRSFWVGQFPETTEVEPNATFEGAQRIELNTTISGVANSEDDDYYVCSLKKGQRLSVEVEAMRLGRTMFDAYVAVLDPRKFEIAACDDAPLLRNDPFVSIIAPEDGDYRVKIHEAAYEGNGECQYRLHIGTFPRPKAVYPPGGKPGETLEFKFLGDPSGPILQTITLPTEPNSRHPLFITQDHLSSPSPQWVTVSPMESVREVEPNQAFDTATQMPPIPSVAYGILELDQKFDCFRFTAKKDQNLNVRVIARAVRSPLDSILSIHQLDGNQLASNDDQGSPDSQIAWTCPADGDYVLRVQDQLARAEGDFTYRLEILEKLPSLAATLPVVERVNSQKWKTFPVPRGNRYATVINVARENFTADSVFAADTLPAGVVMTAPQISKSVTSFPVVFEAAADAPVAGGLHSFHIKSPGPPEIVGTLTDTIHHVEINNEGSYHSVSVQKIAAAVTMEAPFAIEAEIPAVPVVKNGTIPMKIRAIRSEGYNEKISIRFLWSPPGISGPVTVEIPGDKSEISYELNASADAATGTWQICYLAEANTPQGPVVVSTKLVPLRVEDPFVSMTLELAATEQGKNAAMLAKIEVTRPFEGISQVELLGLPHGATSPQQTFSKGDTELIFPLTIAADAAIGKHNGIFCRVIVPDGNQKILHQTATGGTLRIDKPSQVAIPNSPEVKEQPAVIDTTNIVEPAKPLSRLEQLRKRGQ